MKNLWQKFNPSLKKKMDINPRITLLGLWWAGYWRFYVLLSVVSFIILTVFFVVTFVLAKIFF